MLQHKDKILHDCFSCANAFVDDNDKLYCVLKQEYVADNDSCNDWN